MFKILIDTTEIQKAIEVFQNKIKNLAIKTEVQEWVFPSGTQNNTGSNTNNNSYSPTYYGAIAINEKTGNWATAYNYTDKKSAKKSVEERCQGNCKVIQMSPSECGAFAYSKVDEISAYEATGFWWTGQATQQELLKKAEDRALTKCKNKNGKSCKIETSICSYMK